MRTCLLRDGAGKEPVGPSAAPVRGISGPRTDATDGLSKVSGERERSRLWRDFPLERPEVSLGKVCLGECFLLWSRTTRGMPWSPCCRRSVTILGTKTVSAAPATVATAGRIAEDGSPGAGTTGRAGALKVVKATLGSPPSRRTSTPDREIGTARSPAKARFQIGTVTGTGALTVETGTVTAPPPTADTATEDVTGVRTGGAQADNIYSEAAPSRREGGAHADEIGVIANHNTAGSVRKGKTAVGGETGTETAEVPTATPPWNPGGGPKGLLASPELTEKGGKDGTRGTISESQDDDVTGVIQGAPESGYER